MSDEQRVSELVRSFAAQLLPGDREAAARGTAAAVRALVGGASVTEAYAAGRRVVRTWAGHPACQVAAPSGLDLAS